MTGPSITASFAFHSHSSTPAKSLSWWSDSSHSNDYTARVKILRGRQQHLFFIFVSLPHIDNSVSHVRWVGDTLHGAEGLELGTWLSWLSLPVATVTDVLFNTRAGSSSGWSEYKLAHCLLEGECTANVATKYFTCILIPLQLGLMGHLCSPCYFFTCFSF